MQRPTPDCPDPSKPIAAPLVSRVRLRPKCDPPLPVLVPIFVDPLPSGDPDEPVLIPSPYELPSGEMTVNCEQYPAYADSEVVTSVPTGDPVVVAAGEFSERFFWNNLDLTQLELRNIALAQSTLLTPPLLEDYLAAGDVDYFISIGIPEVKAIAITEAWSAIVDRLAERVENLAISRLRCRWISIETSRTCPPADDPLTEEDESVKVYLVQETFTAAAGQFSSEISEEIMLALVEAYLDSITRCRYRNNQITFTCEEGEGEDVTIPADQYEADTPAEVIAILDAVGEGALSCLYPNESLLVACIDLDPNPVWNAEQIVTGEIPYDGVTTGNPIRVAAGTVFSSESTADANAQARALGEALLECIWLNKTITYACDDKDTDASDTDEVAEHVAGTYLGIHALANKTPTIVYLAALEKEVGLLASPSRSPMYSVTIPAGTYASTASQEEANEFAAVAALAQLQCIYCNPRINPVCIPPSIYNGDPIGEAATIDALELPLDPDSIDVNWRSAWSTDATPGVPGIPYEPGAGPSDPWVPFDDFFTEGMPYGSSPPHAVDKVKTFLCSTDPFEVATVADITGVIPLRQITPESRNANCRYGNDEFEAACKAGDLTGGVVTDTRLTPDVGGQNAYFSTNSTQGKVVYAADSLFATGGTPAEAKATANDLAEVVVLSLLDCYFESPELKVYCGALPGQTLPAAATFILKTGSPITVPAVAPAEDTVPAPGFVTTDLLNPVATTSVGYFAASNVALTPAVGATPVTVPYGYGRSYISPADAFDQAILVGAGQLDCFFLGAYTAECVSKPDTRVRRSDGRNNSLVYGSEEADNTSYLPALTGSLRTPLAGQRALYRYQGLATFDEDGLRVPADPLPQLIGTALPYAYGEGSSTLTQLDAETVAVADARSKLDCTHLNWARFSQRCPNPADTLFAPSTTPAATISAESTEEANLQAEALARANTICAECGPFGLAVFGEYGSSPKLRFCGGSAALMGLARNNKGVGAKLNQCLEGGDDEFTMRDVYWENCENPITPGWEWDIPNNVTLFWIKLTCCPAEIPGADFTWEGPDMKFKPAIIIVRKEHAEHPYTEDDVRGVEEEEP